jgi:ribosomal protein S27AE
MSESNERDWHMDSSHENGNYHSTCGTCGNLFLGHKRRLYCKKCTQELLVERLQNLVLHAMHDGFTITVDAVYSGPGLPSNQHMAVRPARGNY